MIRLILVLFFNFRLHIKDCTFTDSQCDDAMKFLMDIIQTTKNQLTDIKEKPSNADPIHGNFIKILVSNYYLYLYIHNVICSYVYNTIRKIKYNNLIKNLHLFTFLP